MEEFTPDAVAKVSKACTSICMWVRAMYIYHNVALGVAPKRAALKAAQVSYMYMPTNYSSDQTLVGLVAAGPVLCLLGLSLGHPDSGVFKCLHLTHIHMAEVKAEQEG